MSIFEVQPGVSPTGVLGKSAAKLNDPTEELENEGGIRFTPSATKDFGNFPISRSLHPGAELLIAQRALGVLVHVDGGQSSATPLKPLWNPSRGPLEV